MKLFQIFSHFKRRYKEAAGTVTLPVWEICNGFIDTLEGCALQGEAFQAVREVFRTLPPEARQGLLSTPKATGGWVSRAQFWRKALQPVLPKKLYHAAMQQILRGLAHAKQVNHLRATELEVPEGLLDF